MISQEMLAGVKNKDVGPAGDSLRQIVTTIRGFSGEELDVNRERCWWERLTNFTGRNVEGATGKDSEARGRGARKTYLIVAGLEPIAPGGFEPQFSDPKSDVLPLDEGAKLGF